MQYRGFANSRCWAVCFHHKHECCVVWSGFPDSRFRPISDRNKSEKPDQIAVFVRFAAGSCASKRAGPFLALRGPGGNLTRVEMDRCKGRMLQPEFGWGEGRQQPFEQRYTEASILACTARRSEVSLPPTWTLRARTGIPSLQNSRCHVPCADGRVRGSAQDWISRCTLAPPRSLICTPESCCAHVGAPSSNWPGAGLPRLQPAYQPPVRPGT
jgi:hypothetical protein